MAKNDHTGKPVSQGQHPAQHPAGQGTPGSSHGEPRPVRDAAAAVAGQARDALTTVKQKGQEAIEGARESVATLPERASDAVACQMKQAAEQLRDRVPQESPLGSAAHSVADGLESGATYLKDHDLREMADDVAGIVRSYPIPAVLAGIGIGFLLGRTLRS